MSLLQSLPSTLIYWEDGGLTAHGMRFKQALVESQRVDTEVDMYIPCGLWAIKTYGCNQ